MKTLLSSIGISLAFLGPSSATVVVNYGSTSYVTATTASQRTSTSNSTTYSGGVGLSEVVAYSESIAFSPASPDYIGPVFYGGWYRSGDNATTPSGSNLRRVVNIAAGDYINATFSYYTGSGATASEGAFITMFLKADFTSLSTTPNLTFDLASPLNMNINVLGKAEVRWMVKDGSTYYISNLSYSTTGLKTLSSADSTTWAIYDPFTSLDFSSESFASHTFTDIQGVGFYAQSNTTVVDVNTASQVGVISFTASVVPEPRVAMLIGVGLVLMLLRRRTVALC